MTVTTRHVLDGDQVWFVLDGISEGSPLAVAARQMEFTSFEEMIDGAVGAQPRCSGVPPRDGWKAYWQKVDQAAHDAASGTLGQASSERPTVPKS